MGKKKTASNMSQGDMLKEALMEKLFNNKDKKEAAFYLGEVFKQHKRPPQPPKEIQTKAEFAKTCSEWDNLQWGTTVESAESNGRKLVIIKERRMKCSSSSQIEWEEVTMRYRMCTYCQSWCRNKTRWCLGCMSEVYCSRTCQKKDWKRHKDECIPMQNAEAIAREERKLHVLEFLREETINT